MRFPSLDQIDLCNQPLIAGYYTLGMISKYRPDIELIHLEEWKTDVEYNWLDQRISKALEQKKIVCICPWEEAIEWPPTPQLFETVNKYADDPVYWITQFVTGTTNSQFKVKIIEIPWWLLNDCLVYNQLRATTAPLKKYKENYLCMLGRYEPHKYQLGKQLHTHNLGDYGLITVAHPQHYPKDHVEFSKTPPVTLYPKLNFHLGKTRGNTIINNVWASGNVENYIALEREFSDIPLVINPDTSCNIIFMTEKLLWPMLLGKLFLLYGNNGIMAAVQRFYDVDISRWADLQFDSIVGWSDEHTQSRLTCMIDHNIDLIKDCRDLHQQLKPELDNASFTVVENFYNFFVKQLDKIQRS